MKLSVIVPVYRAEETLRQCVDSLLAQTYTNFELICVDDGSTDSSGRLLDEYAQKDARIKVIHQENQTAGAARNNGMAHATGNYLLFLDPDDFFEPFMLEKALEKIKENDSDICLFNVYRYDDRTGRRTSNVPDYIRKHIPPLSVFSRKDVPDRIFNMTTGAPWNKLYRTDFVRRHGLRFPVIKNTEDFYFVALSMALAEKITTLDTPLLHYRINVGSSLQATRSRYPVEFEKSFTGVKDRLVELGIYEEVKKSFANRALDSCIYNLESVKGADAFAECYDLIRKELLERYDILGHDPGYFYSARSYWKAMQMLDKTPQEYLLFMYHQQIAPAQSTAKPAGDASKAELARIKSSAAFRIGRMITFVPRKIRDALRGKG